MAVERLGSYRRMCGISEGSLGVRVPDCLFFF